MRALLILAAGLACVACVACAGAPVGGIASYDALAAARSACLAKDGAFALVEGGNTQRLSDYACKRK